MRPIDKSRAALVGASAVLVLACNGGGGGGEDDTTVDGETDTMDVAVEDDATDVLEEEEAWEPPVEICKGVPDTSAGPFFDEKADEVMLGPAGLHVRGNRFMTADLDGDLYPDIIVHKVGSNDRDDPLVDTWEERRRWVLMNRAGGSGRVFEDHTASSAYGEIRDGGGALGRACHLAVAGDVDNDGDLDLFSGTYVDASSGADPADPGDRSEILLNDGSGTFSLAPASDVQGAGPVTTQAASFLDYDRDGVLDIYVGYYYEIYGYLASYPDLLYRGVADGTFTDVTESVGLMTSRSLYGEGGNKPTAGVATCDIDGDGDEDLLQCSYGRQLNMLWINEGGTFVEYGLDTDYASDDGEDYSDNQFYRCHCQLTGDCTAPAPSISCTSDYWSTGMDDQPWRLGGNTFTVMCGDIDNDGDNDVVTTEIRHWHIGSSSDPSQIIRNVPASNERGWTLERWDTLESGMHRAWPPYNWNEGDISAAFIDFDNDGRKDILLMGSDYPPDTRTYLFRQQEDGTFQEIATFAGIDMFNGQEVTVADYDRDGDQDVVMGYSTMRSSSWPGEPPYTERRLFYFENTVGQDGDALQIHLVGDPALGTNAAAIGAKVEVVAGGVTQMQEVGGGYGHYGLQNDLVLHFGVAGTCTVDEVRVTWPDASGTVEVFEDVRANYLVEIIQGSSHPDYVQTLE